MNDLSTPIDFLLTRRSTPAKTLTAPVPDDDDLDKILTAAARVPDHGKVKPWRFVILSQAAGARLGDLAFEIGMDQGRIESRMHIAADTFRTAPMIVAVLSKHDPASKIPLFEQQLSAGAVCLSMVNAALALGYGANWLTGWTASDPDFLRRAFDIEAPDFVAGYIHLGTATNPAPERPRPNLDRIVTRLTA